MTHVIRVPRTFVPGEAHSIAAGFRSQAARVRDLAQQLRNVGGTLDTTGEFGKLCLLAGRPGPANRRNDSNCVG
jgi:hypothetical protein